MTDDGPDIQWCTAPGCVRPATYHPDGMHLTEQGQEFSDQQPTSRPRLRLVGSDPR